MAVEANFILGGEAGQGVQSMGFLLSKIFSRGAYHVFADQDYESRIRGGHNFFRVRIKDSEVGAISPRLDMLLALNKETIDLHRGELKEKGVALYDGEKTRDLEPAANMLSVPLLRLAQEKAGNRIMSNTVLVGAALGMIGYDFEIASTIVREHFGSGEIGEKNVVAARAGYDYAREHYQHAASLSIKPAGTGKRMLLDGNEAIALGALAAGCKFIAAYPMTPTTSILEYLAKVSSDMDIVAVQPEDEIAAACMAVAAGYAGVRSMTATSGSGFCLMTEALGMAGVTETPVVFIEGQRPGPAVGLPTRTEQGDLLFVIHAHQGDFPRAVLAPADAADAFWVTVKAFNLAEKYQMPVIVMTDQHLASSYLTVDKFDISRVSIDRGELYREPDGNKEYKRHQLTRSGISPRAFPGQEGILVITDVDEHDEEGHLTESAQVRTEQMEKRLRKLFGVKEELAEPRRYGPKTVDTLLIGWGSTYGALRETVDILRADGTDVALLHLNELYPFPVGWVQDALDRVKKSYVVENNASGQLARLIRAETGREVSGKILKFDGRPFSPGQIVERIKKEGC